MIDSYRVQVFIYYKFYYTIIMTIITYNGEVVFFGWFISQAEV